MGGICLSNSWRASAVIARLRGETRPSVRRPIRPGSCPLRLASPLVTYSLSKGARRQTPRGRAWGSPAGRNTFCHRTIPFLPEALEPDHTLFAIPSPLFGRRIQGNAPLTPAGRWTKVKITSFRKEWYEPRHFGLLGP